jgi:hypothetical protein
MRACGLDRFLTGSSDVGGKPFPYEAAADQARHTQFVLDDQHPHSRIVTQAR